MLHFYYLLTLWGPIVIMDRLILDGATVRVAVLMHKHEAVHAAIASGECSVVFLFLSMAVVMS